MGEAWGRLIRSRKFWLAVVALVQTLVFQFFPQFSETVWMAIDGIIALVIAGITVEDSTHNIAQGMVARNERELRDLREMRLNVRDLR